MHTVMQYIQFDHCNCIHGIASEIDRLVARGYLSSEQASTVRTDQIAAFFKAEIGRKLLTAERVLREFKFSVLVEPDVACTSSPDDKILLQGVVDCALISDDGIHIVDFKSDKVTADTLEETSKRYRNQLSIYAKALSRIYQKPIVSAQLYFFEIDQFCDII